MGSSRDMELRRWGVEEQRSSEDGEFSKGRVHETGNLGDG